MENIHENQEKIDLHAVATGMPTVLKHRWDQEEGDSLEGVVISFEEEVSKFKTENGEEQNVWVLRLNVDGKETPHTEYCSRVNMREALLRARPKPGDRILIQYRGVASDGRTNLYVVAIDRAEPPF